MKLVKAKEKVVSGWKTLTNNTKIQIEKPYLETEYYLLEEKLKKTINTKSKKEMEIEKAVYVHQMLIIMLMIIYILIL